jgi:hypothetical protein
LTKLIELALFSEDGYTQPDAAAALASLLQANEHGKQPTHANLPSPDQRKSRTMTNDLVGKFGRLNGTTNKAENYLKKCRTARFFSSASFPATNNW